MIGAMETELLALFDTPPPTKTHTTCPNCINDRPGGWITENQPHQICRGCGLGYFKSGKEVAMEFLATFGWDHHKDVLGVHLARQGPETLRKAHAMSLRWIEAAEKTKDQSAEKLGPALQTAVFWGFVALHGRYPEDGKEEVEKWLKQEAI